MVKLYYKAYPSIFEKSAIFGGGCADLRQQASRLARSFGVIVVHCHLVKERIHRGFKVASAVMAAAKSSLSSAFALAFSMAFEWPQTAVFLLLAQKPLVRGVLSGFAVFFLFNPQNISRPLDPGQQIGPIIRLKERSKRLNPLDDHHQVILSAKRDLSVDQVVTSTLVDQIDISRSAKNDKGDHFSVWLNFGGFFEFFYQEILEIYRPTSKCILILISYFLRIREGHFELKSSLSFSSKNILLCLNPSSST